MYTFQHIFKKLSKQCMKEKSKENNCLFLNTASALSRSTSSKSKINICNAKLNILSIYFPFRNKDFQPKSCFKSERVRLKKRCRIPCILLMSEGGFLEQLGQVDNLASYRQCKSFLNFW